VPRGASCRTPRAALAVNSSACLLTRGRLLGAVSSVTGALSLSSALIHRWHPVQRPWVSVQVRMFRKSVRDNFTPADGPFYISKGSVAA
jgi:hypothetical protein